MAILLPFIRSRQNHLVRHSEREMDGEVSKGGGRTTTSENGQAMLNREWRIGKTGEN